MYASKSRAASGKRGGDEPRVNWGISEDLEFSLQPLPRFSKAVKSHSVPRKPIPLEKRSSPQAESQSAGVSPAQVESAWK